MISDENKKKLLVFAQVKADGGEAMRTMGRNPETGQKIKVGKKSLPYFKVGMELKAMVDGTVK